MKSKTNRGGKRPGAGPPTGNTNAQKGKRKRQRITFTLPPWLIKWLRGSEGNASQMVEEALVKYYGIAPDGEKEE